MENPKGYFRTKGVEARFPKDVLSEAYLGKLIDDEKSWIDMLRDINLTSHTYDENLADQIYENIKRYAPVLRQEFDKLKKLQ